MQFVSPLLEFSFWPDADGLCLIALHNRLQITTLSARRPILSQPRSVVGSVYCVVCCDGPDLEYLARVHGKWAKGTDVVLVIESVADPCP